MPAGYHPAWVRWAEAVAHVVRVARCGRDEAIEGLRLSLQDGNVESRYANTDEVVGAQAWLPPLILLEGEPLIGEAGRPIEFRRAHIERLWPAASEPTQLTDVPPDTEANPAPKPPPEPLTAFVLRYIADERAKKRQPTQYGLEAAWSAARRRGNRDRLRAEFKHVMGGAALERGRPRKSQK